MLCPLWLKRHHGREQLLLSGLRRDCFGFSQLGLWLRLRLRFDLALFFLLGLLFLFVLLGGGLAQLLRHKLIKLRILGSLEYLQVDLSPNQLSDIPSGPESGYREIFNFPKRTGGGGATLARFWGLDLFASRTQLVRAIGGGGQRGGGRQIERQSSHFIELFLEFLLDHGQPPEERKRAL